jgi:hypothetical protein
VRVEEQVGQRAPALLAGVVGLDERGGAGGPRRRRDLAAVQQHDDDGRACIIYGRLYVMYMVATIEIYSVKTTTGVPVAARAASRASCIPSRPREVRSIICKASALRYKSL